MSATTVDGVVPAAEQPAAESRAAESPATESRAAESRAAERLAAEIERLAAAGEGPPRPARDPVNLPMIRNWLEALGDANPLYLAEQLTPPAMTQVWTMRGLRPAPDAGDPLATMSGVLDEAGYTSVVATNCEQTYHRYVRVGEQLEVRSRLVDAVGPKRTSLGEGWFVTTESTWYAGAEPVASMLFRVLKFRPAPPPSTVDRVAGNEPLRPVVSPDTAFFWAGTAAGELRIQRCADCGLLRHPPGPACPGCGAMRPGYVVAAGTGEIYSYVVHHHPPVPGRRLPMVVALVELAEGVRVVGELLDAEPTHIRIGAPVEVAFDRVDDELTLPAWRLRSGVGVGDLLPPLRIEVSPTFVISTALATRDFQDVHHDRDRAIERGSKDIFLNILTTTGLVQRFVTDWAGSAARVRGISIRLGVPCYAYDTLTLTGRATGCDGGETTVEVVGRSRLGAHVTGTARLWLPGEALS
jgi:uncharacterized protein